MLGDTTTTMMWIAGVSPLKVLDAYLPAAVALIVFGIPASRLQQGYSAIIKQPSRRLQIAWVPLFIVGAILIAVVLTNVISNIKFPAVLDKAPVLGLAVWAVILATIRCGVPIGASCRRP